MKTLVIGLVILAAFAAGLFAIAYFAFDWGIPTQERAITGAVDAWANGQTAELGRYVAEGSPAIVDEFKAIPLPVIRVSVERVEKTPDGGVRATVVVTSGKQTAQADLRYAFELKRFGLKWLITRVALL